MAERGHDANQRRADVYSSARIGAAAALTIVLVVLLVLDVAVPDYDISPGILLPRGGLEPEQREDRVQEHRASDDCWHLVAPGDHAG